MNVWNGKLDVHEQMRVKLYLVKAKHCGSLKQIWAVKFIKRHKAHARYTGNHKNNKYIIL